VWKNKAYRATIIAVIELISHGGAHSRRLIVGEYPIVATNVGKNMLNDIDELQQANAVPVNQALQSVIIDRRSEKALDVLSSAGPWPLESSSIRLRARESSADVSQRAGPEGKSGSMNIPQIPTKTVKKPSTKNSHLIAVKIYNIH
jgi:hypothetical protein